MKQNRFLTWPILQLIVLKFKSILKTQNWVLPIALMVVGVILLGSGLDNSKSTNLIGIQPAIAQRISPGEIWQLVYQQLPDFPKENHYLSKETGKAAENHTLAGRLIRYHIYIKERTPNYRLDWKLTLADYLNTNETMYDVTYPGFDVLRENPIEGDRKAISKLTRSQRNALVQVLINIFTGNSANTP
jgi:hypothetical protein